MTYKVLEILGPGAPHRKGPTDTRGSPPSGCFRRICVNVRAKVASDLGSVFVLATALCYLLVVCAGCSTNSPLVPLLNQGLVPISADNPFMGSNVSLAREMERSSYLLNFVRQNGPPQAIEFVGDSVESAELRLYYAHGRHYFGATLVTVDSEAADASASDTPTASRGSSHQWIIRGPYPVKREYYRHLSSLPSTSRATFELFGTRHLFGADAAAEHRYEIKPVFIPTPSPPPPPKPRRRRTVRTGSDGAASNSSTNSAINFDQRALLEAKSLAQRNPNGELIHTVKSATETINSITSWYTGTAKNADQIAQANDVPVDAKLTPGKKILIPGGLVTNPRALP